jgi:hypothetical protein
MVRGFTREVKAILLRNGCSLKRQGKGDHEVWISPNAKRPFVVDGRIMSRSTANAVLKQAGLKERID